MVYTVLRYVPRYLKNTLFLKILQILSYQVHDSNHDNQFRWGLKLFGYITVCNNLQVCKL